MADLSKRLPTEIDSQQRYIQPSAPAPSFLEHLANFGSNLIGVAETAQGAMSNDAARKQHAGDVAASNAVAKTVYDINGPQQPQPSVVNTPTSDPGHNAAVTAVKAAAPGMLNAQTAGDQGAMDPGMVQARNVAAIRQLMGRFPGHEAAIATAARELGVQNMLTQQYENAVHAATSDQDAALQRRHDLEHDAVTRDGWSNYDSLSEPEKQVVLAQTALKNAALADLDYKSKQIDLLTKKQNLSTTEMTAGKTQLSSGLAQSITDLMGKSSTSLMSVLMSNFTDPALQADPMRLEKAASNFLAVGIPALDKQYATLIGPHLTKLTPEDRAAVDQYYQTQRKALVDFVTGPTSVVEQTGRLFKELSDTYGLDFAKAAPKMMMYRQIVGQQGLAQLLDPTLLKDPVLMKSMTDELKGYVNGKEGVADFTTHLQTLTDNADLKTFTPQQIAAQAPLQIASMHKLSLSQTANNGTDTESHKMLVKAIGNTSWIAAGANEGWGFKELLYQGKALTDDRVARSLFVASANPDARKDAIRAYIPAVARTYESLQRTNAGDAFYDLKFDSHTLNWKPVWNGKMMISPDPKSIPAGVDPMVAQMSGLGIKSQPKPTGAIVDQAATLNHMLHRLSDAAAHGYDPTFDGKKITYMEARKFYANDEIPASMKPSTDGKGKNGKTPEQNIQDAVDHMMDFANKLQYTPEPPVAGPKSSGELDSYYRGKGKANLAFYQENAPKVQAAAAAHGVPTDIAMNLIHTESKFNPAADSGKAGGIGQISYKEAERRGWPNPKTGMTVDENINHSMEILAENYKATGNWHDAVSMYFSGHPLKTGANLSDGNTTGLNYTAGIVAGTPDLDTSGAMPLGVKTPYGTRI